MPLNFPTTGLIAGETIYTYSGNTWIWNGFAWDSVTTPESVGLTAYVRTWNGQTGDVGFSNYVVGITGTANQVTVSGFTGSVTVGLPNNVNVVGNLSIGGNLTVSGGVTSTFSETVLIEDNFITLNSNVTGGSPSENAGIEVSRGASANVQIRWNESTDNWQFTNDGTVFYDIPTSATGPTGPTGAIGPTGLGFQTLLSGTTIELPGVGTGITLNISNVDLAQTAYSVGQYVHIVNSQDSLSPTVGRRWISGYITGITGNNLGVFRDRASAASWVSGNSWQINLSGRNGREHAGMVSRSEVPTTISKTDDFNFLITGISLSNTAYYYGNYVSVVDINQDVYIDGTVIGIDYDANTIEIQLLADPVGVIQTNAALDAQQLDEQTWFINLAGAPGTITEPVGTSGLVVTKIATSSETTYEFSNTGVLSFNGLTGHVSGVNTVNGFTGGITFAAGTGITLGITQNIITISTTNTSGVTGATGPQGNTGPTGAIPTDYVISVDGATGAVTIPKWTNTLAGFSNGIASGVTFGVGDNAIQVLERLVYPYQAVSFTAFSVGLAASTFDIGATSAAGNYTTTWSTSGPTGNWIAGSIYVSRSGTGLTGGLNYNSTPVTITHPAYRYTTPTTLSFSLTGQQQSGSGLSRSQTYSWLHRVYWGKSASASPTSLSDLTTGSNSRYTSSTTSLGGFTYTFLASASAEYSYVITPTSPGSPGTYSTWKDINNLTVTPNSGTFTEINSNGVSISWTWYQVSLPTTSTYQITAS